MFQKFALVRIQRQRAAVGLPPTHHSDYLKSCLWWLGIGIMILGEGGNFLAYGFGPASVVAPLGTTTVVGMYCHIMYSQSQSYTFSAVNYVNELISAYKFGCVII